MARCPPYPPASRGASPPRSPTFQSSSDGAVENRPSRFDVPAGQTNRTRLSPSVDRYLGGIREVMTPVNVNTSPVPFSVTLDGTLRVISVGSLDRSPLLR